MNTQPDTRTDVYQYSVQFNQYSSAGGAMDTLEGALSEAFRQASYYLLIGRENVAIEITQDCPKCSYGWKGRKGHEKRCTHPGCNWGCVPVVQRFPVRLHENVEHIACEDVLYSHARVVAS